MPHGMLPYDPFVNEESLLLDSEIKKSLDYIQHQQQMAQSGPSSISEQLSSREKAMKKAMKSKTSMPNAIQDKKMYVSLLFH